MNENDAIQHMIKFVEQKERQIASNKLASATPNRNDAVKAILDELERTQQSTTQTVNTGDNHKIYPQIGSSVVKLLNHPHNFVKGRSVHLCARIAIIGKQQQTG